MKKLFSKHFCLVLLIGLLAIIFAFMLVACGGTETPADNNQTVVPSTQPQTPQGGDAQQGGDEQTPDDNSGSGQTPDANQTPDNGGQTPDDNGGDVNSQNPDDGGQTPDDNGGNQQTPDDNNQNNQTPDDNGGDNGGEVNPQNPNNGGQTPDNGGENNTPNPDQTPPATLDFSALEAKLEEVITSQSKYNTINQILSYSIKDGKLYVAYDYNTKYDSIIAVYSFETTEDLSSQESIDNLVAEIDISNFEGIEFGKATEDIVVDDVTYSKAGIEGDNPFARQCGVNNALMTYVSDIETPHLNPQTETHYSSGYNVLIIYQNNDELYVLLQGIGVECGPYATQEEILQLALAGNSYVGGNLVLSTPINLGQNLKADSILNNPPATLDFSALEAKLEEVILSTGRNMQINQMLSYSIENDKLNILVDMVKSGADIINLYTVTNADLDFSTQEKINAFVNAFDKTMLDKTDSGSTKTEISFVKALSDIVVDGTTYSKAGIEGDNPFARQCGVENALMTYVSDMGGQSFGDFDTGYARTVKVLVVSNSEENGITVTECSFGVESDYGITNEQLYQNLITEGKNVLDYKNIYNLGQNLKVDSILN